MALHLTKTRPNREERGQESSKALLYNFILITGGTSLDQRTVFTTSNSFEVHQNDSYPNVCLTKFHFQYSQLIIGKLSFEANLGGRNQSPGGIYSKDKAAANCKSGCASPRNPSRTCLEKVFLDPI